MRNHSFLISVAFFAALLAGCSGGGGGGSTGGSPTKNAKYGVRVLHAVLDGAPLTLFSSARPAESLAVVRFGSPAFYLGLPAGEQRLSLFKGENASGELLSQTLNISKDTKQTILYYGNHSYLGTSTALIADQIPLLESGSAAFRFIHACAGAASIRFGLNDPVTGNYSELAGDLPFGGASAYFSVEPGVRQLRAFRGADGKEIVSSAKLLEAGTAYTILLLGEVDYLVLAEQYTDNR